MSQQRAPTGSITSATETEPPSPTVIRDSGSIYESQYSVNAQENEQQSNEEHRQTLLGNRLFDNSADGTELGLDLSSDLAMARCYLLSRSQR